MTLSILLTDAWDSRTENTPLRLEVPKVRPHRFSWKHAGTVGFPRGPWGVKEQRCTEDDETLLSEEAEVVTSSSDEKIFEKLHGVTARDANYDELVEVLAGDEHKGILNVIKEMALQYPDAMWFVRSWAVDAAPFD